MAPTTPPSDAELDALVRTRLRQSGIDLNQLPAAAQTSALASCRSQLRASRQISDYAADPQNWPPVLYPAPFSEWTR
jgi:hypothetical protein